MSAPAMAVTKSDFHNPLSVGWRRLPRESQHLTMGSMPSALS
jgi:hypothetical protein